MADEPESPIKADIDRMRADLGVMAVLTETGLPLRSPEMKALARKLSPEHCPCCGLPWPKETIDG